jgi:chloramphenicol O-acetyltransferase type B
MDIGRHSNIAGTGSNISAKVTVGSFTSVAAYVTMIERTNHSCIEFPNLVSTYQFTGYPRPYSVDRIEIGSDVWIGTHAVLLGGITVGHGAIVGAFAVVAKDVPPYAVVVGNPARVIRYRFSPERIAQLLKLRWWDWDDATIKARMAELQDIDVLLGTDSEYHPDIEKHVRFVTD